MVNKKVKSLQIGAHAPESRVYRCSTCGSLNALLENDIVTHCETCEISGKTQYWVPTAKRIMPVSRDIGKEFDKRKNKSYPAAKIAIFSQQIIKNLALYKISEKTFKIYLHSINRFGGPHPITHQEQDFLPRPLPIWR